MPQTKRPGNALTDAQARLDAAGRLVIEAQALADRATLALQYAQEQLTAVERAVQNAEASADLGNTALPSSAVVDAIQTRAHVHAVSTVPDNGVDFDNRIRENLVAVEQAQLAWDNSKAITIGWGNTRSKDYKLGPFKLPIAPFDRPHLTSLHATIGSLGDGYNVLKTLNPIFKQQGTESITLAGFQADSATKIEQLASLGIEPLLRVNATTARYDRTAIEIITGRNLS